MDEKKIKHLEFIQSIINRMNSNSFAIKGWAITIVSALLALYASSSKVTYVFVAIIPTLKSASNLNGNLNCSKELEHYAS